jgi:bifunctional DNase/RNase
MADVKVIKAGKRWRKNEGTLTLSDDSGKKLTMISVLLEKALYIKEVLEGKKIPSNDIYGLIDPQLRSELMKRVGSGQKPVDVTIYAKDDSYKGNVGLNVNGSSDILTGYKASDTILIALRYEIPIRVSDHLLH